MFADQRPLTTGLTASTPSFWARNFAGSRLLDARKRFWFRRSPELKLIKKYVAPGGAVLDAGSGDGSWVQFLIEQGYRGTGIDYSDELLQQAATNYPQGEWQRGDIRTMPFASDSFDGIISWGVVEHEPEGPGPALQEFLRVLKPGGRIVATVPADHALQHRLVAEQQRLYGDAKLGFFQYFFTAAEFAKEVEAVGFKVLESAHLRSPSAEFVAPRLYVRYWANPVIFRLLRLASLFVPMGPHNTMMVYCVAEKPAR